MEFFENRPKRPFIGFLFLWQAFKKWRIRSQTRQVLHRLSDAQLRDVGLRREDVR